MVDYTKLGGSALVHFYGPSISTANRLEVQCVERTVVLLKRIRSEFGFRPCEGAHQRAYPLQPVVYDLTVRSTHVWMYPEESVIGLCIFLMGACFVCLFSSCPRQYPT